MKIFIKNKLLTVTLAVLLMLAITGCSFIPNIGYSNNNRIDKTTVSVSWWGNDKRHEYTMDALKVFEDKNPDIKLKYSYCVWNGYDTRMQVLMESCTESDVMQINFPWLNKYSPDGEGYYDLYQLSDYIDLTQYDPEDLKYGVVNGKLNAIPIALNTNEFFYNADIWQKYGLDYPSSWDDWFTAAKIMQKDGIYPLGMVRKQVFLLCVAYVEQTYGTKLYNDRGKFIGKNEDLEHLFEFYARLINEGVIMPIDDFSRNNFGEGKVASVFCWVSDAGTYCSFLEENGGTPVIGGQFIDPNARSNGWYIKPASFLGISKYTEHPEKAARVLNFMLNSPEMAIRQLNEKGVPVSKSALEVVQKECEGKGDNYEFEASRYMNDHRDQMDVINSSLENEDIIAKFKSYGDDYIYGKKELSVVAKELKSDIISILNE